MKFDNNTGTSRVTIRGDGLISTVGDLDVAGDSTSGATLELTSNSSTQGVISWDTFSEFGPRSDILSHSAGVITFDKAGTYMISGILGVNVTNPNDFYLTLQYEDTSGTDLLSRATTMTGSGLIYGSSSISYIETVSAATTRRFAWVTVGTGTTPTILNNTRTQFQIIKL